MNRRSFMRSTLASAVLAAGAKTFGITVATELPAIRLSSLRPRLVNQGWGSLFFDQSADGKPLQIGDRSFKHGVSTHARSDLVYLVGGRYSRLRAWVGIDAASSRLLEATARFLVYADGRKLFDSEVMQQNTPATQLDVDVSSVNVLRLVVTYVGAYANHVDWAEAELTPDPHSATIPFGVPKASLERIRSGNLTFICGGSSLAGFELPNGKSINLQGSFGLGSHVRSSDATVDTAAKFESARDGLAWDWECSSHSHQTWSAPVDTVFQWGDPMRAKVWLPRGYGSVWQDPLVPQQFEDLTLDYGAFFNREDGLSLPMASILDEENGMGITFIQSPRDVLLDLQISTTKKGEIRFSRAFHRFGGNPRKTAFHMDIVVHEPDVRAALNAIVTRYPEYFEPPCKLAHQVGGGGAYSGWEGPIDAKKLAAMGFTMNWKASLDFPYMGQFLPPVKDDDEKWNRFAGGGEGVFTSADEGRFGQTSIRQMAAYSSDMRAQGFHVLNYFNVTEFGTQIKYPAPPSKDRHDPSLWRDANDFLHDRMEDAVLKTPDPIWTWGAGVIMDCGDPTYRDFLLQQAKRHVEKLPDSSGICIDRMDWLTRYNPHADDGATWIDGPSRHLRRSWISLMEELGPVFHNAGKVIFANDMDRRLELMQHVDGFYDEHGYFPHNLNASAFLALRKPLVCWISDENPFGANPDAFFQRLLYMGGFPTVPFRGNDHSVLPSEANERLSLEYGPLFNALRGRTWLLKPGIVEVVEGNAKANVFETPSHYVVFVGLAGRKENAQIRLRGLSGVAKVLYPGEPDDTNLQVHQNGSAALEVPLKRGCAMLILNKS